MVEQPPARLPRRPAARKARLGHRGIAHLNRRLMPSGWTALVGIDANVGLWPVDIDLRGAHVCDLDFWPLLRRAAGFNRSRETGQREGAERRKRSAFYQRSSGEMSHREIPSFASLL